MGMLFQRHLLRHDNFLKGTLQNAKHNIILSFTTRNGSHSRFLLQKAGAESIWQLDFLITSLGQRSRATGNEEKKQRIKTKQ